MKPRAGLHVEHGGDRAPALGVAPTDTGGNESATATAVDEQTLRERIIDALRGIYDPEIPVNIYDLGLIYGIDIAPGGVVDVQMTLTTPGCPVAQSFPASVEANVEYVEGVSEAHVEVVWDPPWTMDRMDEATRLQLGLL